MLRPFDAILLGAVGWPAELPDHVTLAPLVTLRQRFDQYACVRPARLFAGLNSLLAGKGPDDIDLVVIRENSEGEYVDNGGRIRRGTPDEFSVQTAIHTRRGIERILRFGFAMARTRRRHLTMITKSNALRHAYVLWDDVFDELAPQFPDVATDKQHADAAAMNLVRRPETFDRGRGLEPVRRYPYRPGRHNRRRAGAGAEHKHKPGATDPSMFEPVHGSAPDIAGRGIANPIAAILSAAMMLDWLGQTAAGTEIRAAVESTLAAGTRPPTWEANSQPPTWASRLSQRLIERCLSLGPLREATPVYCDFATPDRPGSPPHTVQPSTSASPVSMQMTFPFCVPA